MDIKEKQHSGMIYYPMGDEILVEQMGYMDALRKYEAIPRVNQEARFAKLKDQLDSILEQEEIFLG